MPTTHYQTLGIKPSATPEQIRRAYRELAKTLHPDVNPAKDAQARFMRVAAAYAVLSKATSRREYDLKLAAQAASARTRSASDLRQGHYTWVNVAGTPSERDVDISEVDELFDTFFGRAHPPAKPARPARTGPSKQEPNKRQARKPGARRRASG